MSEGEKSYEILNQRGIYEILKYAKSSAQIGQKEKAFQLIRGSLQAYAYFTEIQQFIMIYSS